MGYEIDFLPVGTDKPGDAIALRFGNLFGPRSSQAVVVLDGGYADTGDQVIEHVKTYYGTTKIDLLISTHPDQDHVGGLETILTKCEIGALWMHRPWNHTQQIAQLFEDGRVTDNSIRASLRESLDNAHAIEKIALRKNIPVTEPFVGVSYYPFRSDSPQNAALAQMGLNVIGPSRSFYETLLPEFRCLPETAEPASLMRSLVQKIGDAATTVAERWGFETLDDSGETTPENNSSLILLGNMGPNERFILTSDAGIPALSEAVLLLQRNNFNFESLKFTQVPHHGSRRNVGPTLLDQLLGPKLTFDPPTKRYAIVSATTLDHPKHPSKKVLNAFRRRGWEVHATAGITKRHQQGAPTRPTWGISIPAPFFNEVEE
jgi:beta-lactamase superfamily II metal-dependent hydrolase